MFDVAVQATRAQMHNQIGKIVWGGFHPTTMPQQALDFVDMVCVGGEHAFPELIERLEAGEDHYDVGTFCSASSMAKS